MRRMTAIGLVAGVMVAAAMGSPGCTRPSAATRSTSRPSVAVARVTKGDVTQALSVAAEFRPFQEIDVHSKVAGYLKAINVDVGDRVQAGQLLAVLEVPELQTNCIRTKPPSSGRRRKSIARRRISTAPNRSTSSRIWARAGSRAC